MKKVLALINMIVILGVIAWNYYTTINGFNGSEVGSVSDNLENLFTPSGYAFSIWGIIFLGLIIAGIQIVILAFNKSTNSIVERIAPTLIAANLFNCAWVYVWLSLMPGLSTLIMTAILICLILTVLAIDKTKIQESSILNWTIGVPIRIYLGWIMVATIANYSAFLNTTSFSSFLGEAAWFYIMMAIGTGLISFVVWRKGWYEVPIVGIWSFTAIVVRHMDEERYLAYFTIICIIFLVVAIIAKVLKTKNPKSVLE